MLSLSTSFADAMAEAAALYIDDNSGNAAKVVLYDGTRPATIDDAITTQTVIAEIDLPSGIPFVFKIATDDYVAWELSTSSPAFIDTAGNVSFFRLFNNLGEAIMDGDVTDPSGSGDMKISMVAVTQGFLVKIISFVYKIARKP